MLTIVDIRLRTFPSKDREFGRFAKAALAALGASPTPDSFQRSLRARYPAAVISTQSDLARHGEGPPIWYAFRTSVMGERFSPEREVEAWAIVDDQQRFIEVSEPLSKIVELPVRHILGHRVEDFSSPDDPTIREDLQELWREFQRSGTIVSTLRFNFADGRPRELEYKLIANADGPGRHRLLVWVVPEAPPTGEPVD